MSRDDRSFGLGLLFAVLLGLVLRTTALGAPPFWLDEIHSLSNSAGRRAELAVPVDRIVGSVADLTRIEPDMTVLGVFQGMRNDTHPPLYFELLFGWRRLFGDGAFAVRALSVLFSVLTLPTAALLLRELGAPRAGVLYAFVLAASYLPLAVGQDARPYALAGLLVSLAAWAFVRSQREGRDAWRFRFGYGLAVLLTALTHYFALLSLPAAFLVGPKLGRATKLAALVALGAALLFGILWGPSLAAQLPQIGRQSWLETSAGWLPAATLRRVMAAPLAMLLFLPGGRAAALPVALAGALLQLVLAVWLLRRPSPAALLCAAWYALPVAVFALTDVYSGRQVMSQPRYLAVAFLGFAGLFALFLDALPRRVRLASLSALALAAALTLPVPPPKDFQAVAAQPAAGLASYGDLVIFASLDRSYGWGRNAYVPVAHQLDEGVAFLVLSRPPSRELLAEIDAFPRLVVVAPRVAPRPPNPLPGRFAPEGPPRFHPGVGVVYVFRRV